MKKYFNLLFILIPFTIPAVAQNQNISGGTLFEGEPFIAINPLSPQHMVVCWMGFDPGNGSGLTIKVRSTFDGGVFWTPAVTMPHMSPTHTSADPSMAFDENGILFISYIDYRKNPDSGGVYISRSFDGGINWNNPVKAIDAYDDGSRIPVDRPWLSISKEGDRAYLTTKPAPWIPAPNRPYFLASSDSGQTWGGWRYIDSTGFLVGNLIAAPMAAPAVATNGAFNAVYPSFVLSQALFPQFILARTTNDGNSFSYSTVLNITAPASNDSAKLAYLLLADPSDSNHLVFVFPDATAGDIDILMTESFNNGINWSATQRINDDASGNGVMQDMLWGAFDSDGDLLISWRDRRNGTGSGFAVASGYYAAFRDKDSLLFEPNFALSDSLVAFHAILAQDGNDFMSVVLQNDTVSAVWSNTRDGSLDVWFSRMNARTGAVAGIALLSSESADFRVYPNPGTGTFFVSGAAPADQISVFNQQGILILTKTMNGIHAQVDLSGHPPGIYVIQLLKGNHQLNKKIVKE